MGDPLTVSSVRIAEGDAVVAVAYNYHDTRMACASAKNSIKVYDLEGAGKAKLSGEFQVSAALRKGEEMRLAWAHPEFGQVLVVSAAGQAATVWRESPNGQGRAWIAAATLSESRAPVRDLAFAPKEYGAMLAVADGDGVVRLYEAEEPLDAESWPMVDSFRATAAGECTCLTWREATVEGPPPLLLVGTSDIGASIWRYDEPLMKWQECKRIASAAAPVSCLSWAPSLGRPHELVAVGASSSVEIWSLKGATDSSMAVNKVGTLGTVPAKVWKVEWNMLGTALAVSTDKSEVLVFTPNLLGDFQLSGKFVGDGVAEENEDVAMSR